MANPGMTSAELAEQAGVDVHITEKNLADMEREGFLYQINSGYRVCDDTKKG
jgi:DNA-binding transcriptional regulator YhcF (GntR family)